MPYRRDGRRAINDMGPYVFGYRAKMLKRLLEVQHDLQMHDPKIKLISDQELIAIQVNWYRDFNFGYQVSEIYNSIYKESFNMEENVKNKLEADLMIARQEAMEVIDIKKEKMHNYLFCLFTMLGVK